MKIQNDPPTTFAQRLRSDSLYHILNLWYRDCYEEVCNKLEKLQLQLELYKSKYLEIRRALEVTRRSNRIQQRRIQEMQDTIQLKNRLFREIFEQFPEVRSQYDYMQVLSSDSETDTDEDLAYLPVRRRLRY